MVWELNANCIAMLTKIFDFMKVMCIQYWPMTSCTYGQVHVETLDTKTYAYFIIRTFQICRAYQDGGPMPGATKRIVKHFHFTEWEANALPYVTALLDFRRRIRAYLRSPAGATKSPMIVHCSNGGARSGIFLALDANLELVRAEGLVDIFGYCKTLINARQELIGNIEQYKFMYELLAEGVSCSLHAIPTTELKNRGALYTTKKSRQEMEALQAEEYRLLCIWSPPLKIGDCAGGHRLENRSKNRDVMVVPPDYARPYLSTLHGESKDYTYINAFYVDGFTTKNEWIITEWPKHQTVDSFWTLIFDHFCFAVVNLTNGQGKSKPFPSYVHNKGQQNYGPFVIEVIYHRNFPNMTLHTVKIMKKSLTLHDMLGLSSIKHNISEADSRICHLIQVKTWPLDSKVPLSTASLIYLLKIVRELRHQASLDKTEHKPIVVMSHNGISRCGIFVAAHICIDQMEMDDEVDIFRACKSVRMNRPQLIDTKEEFKYLHDLILHYANLYDEYKKNNNAMPIRDEAYKHLFGTNNFTREWRIFEGELDFILFLYLHSKLPDRFSEMINLIH
uniref:Receptor-type tyrosine-protein phosphatase mu n=1 Tax=Romanomermis culicivorax TaxID=13658 RepID=A0A915HUX3_ROMCU